MEGARMAQSSRHATGPADAGGDCNAGMKPPLPPTPGKGPSRGARLIACSAAGTAAAAAATASRWLLAESGEVLLLFASSDGEERQCGGSGDGDALLLDADFAIDPDFQCVGYGEETSGIRTLGEALLSVASSPHLRAAPLVLLFLSSTVFVVGVILTRRELRQFLSWARACREYGDECSQQVMSLVGVSNQDELMIKLKESHVKLKGAIWDRVDQTMDQLDGMVLDDVLRRWAKAGIEFSMGVWGGVALYSLPEEMFANSGAAQDTRRRLIRAADPSLERMIFHPGGVLDAVPSCLKESLVRTRLTKGGAMLEAGTEATSVASNDDSRDIDEDSSDTPLASPVQAGEAKGASRHYLPIRVVQAGEGVSPTQANDDVPRESISEALSASISVLLLSKLAAAPKPSIGAQSHKSSDHEHEVETEPSPPVLRLDKVLHGTSVAASLLFLCHLRGSPSTRRAWGSAAHFMTSIGLATTAISSAVLSIVLRSNTLPFASSTHDQIVGMVWLKVCAGLGYQPDAFPVGAWIERMRKELRNNKRLQSAMAFIVLYGMRRLTRKGGMRVMYQGKGIQ